MQVAIVGSRRGASRDDVEGFVRSMWVKDKTIVLVSGGADGPDKWAEDEWMKLGGRVLSYRAYQRDKGDWGVQLWKIGSWTKIQQIDLIHEPTFATRESALLYRDSLIAEEADVVNGFFGTYRTTGTQTTLDFAYGAGKQTYEYFRR